MKDKVKAKAAWREEAEAAAKPGAKKCGSCGFFKCRCKGKL